MKKVIISKENFVLLLEEELSKKNYQSTFDFDYQILWDGKSILDQTSFMKDHVDNKK